MTPAIHRSSAGLLVLAWAVLTAVALWARPLMPVDETRYVGVAWEMWLRGDFLVPYLNGEPYSHKPPLLFWLMQAGWGLFGVNDLWPRLIGPLLGLVCLGLTVLLARRLWPSQPAAAQLAPWLLFGGLFFAGFLTLTQFDLLIVACTLLGMLGLWHAAAGSRAGWGWLGLAIGLGLLSKGPVILLHLLPAALLAPLWRGSDRPGWRAWYAGVFTAVLLGALIGLAWALPATQAGGVEYRQAIFWGQTAERVVDSFAHQQPFWWYLVWLPVLLLPWSLWPPLWRAARAAGRAALDDRGGRLLLCWVLPTLLLLSLVSGKQAKYLLPMFPALALLAAWWLARAESVRLPSRQWLAVFLLAVPTLLFVALALHGPWPHPHWSEALRPAWGAAFLLAALLGWAWRPATPAGA
ncbi:MAG: ArnT family glycosyltransferase, partial [Gammaproteobacteria bacterium]